MLSYSERDSSVPGRCDDLVVVVRFGTYKVGFQVKDRAAPVVFCW